MGAPMPAEHYLRTFGDAVVLLTVVEVENPGATQGSPPRLSIEVTEVLRGACPTGRVRASWAPGSDPFYAMRAGGDAYMAWLAAPLPPPAVGERFVAVLSGPAAPAPEPPEPGAPTSAVPVPPAPPGVPPPEAGVVPPPWRVESTARFPLDAEREAWARAVIAAA